MIVIINQIDSQNHISYNNQSSQITYKIKKYQTVYNRNFLSFNYTREEYDWEQEKNQKNRENY